MCDQAPKVLSWRNIPCHGRTFLIPHLHKELSHYRQVEDGDGQLAGTQSGTRSNLKEQKLYANYM